MVLQTLHRSSLAPPLLLQLAKPFWGLSVGQPWLLIEWRCEVGPMKRKDEYGTRNFDGVSHFSISHFLGGHTPFSDISRDEWMDRQWVKHGQRSDVWLLLQCQRIWSWKPPSCTKRNVILGFQAASSQMKRYLSRSNMTLTLPLLKTSNEALQFSDVLAFRVRRMWSAHHLMSVLLLWNSMGCWMLQVAQHAQRTLLSDLVALANILQKNGLVALFPGLWD